MHCRYVISVQILCTITASLHSISIILAMASSPTVSSVVWNSASAMVSFLPPAYGAQCVDYYVVTAVSEDGKVLCSATNDDLVHNCDIPTSTNVNDYTFTVYAVTSGVDGALYNGNIATDCCMSSIMHVEIIYNINTCNRSIFSRECSSI